MKILIGSKNSAKIEGARQAFATYYDDVDVVGISVDSGVSEQPVNLDIMQGARNRVEALIDYARYNEIDADFYVAIESGITNSLGSWMIINITAISDGENWSFGSSAGFPVPEKYVASIMSHSLGSVMDKLYDREDLRSHGGGISLISHGHVSRIDLTRDAFLMALTQFIDEKWRN